jgi:hypothetical protein
MSLDTRKRGRTTCRKKMIILLRRSPIRCGMGTDQRLPSLYRSPTRTDAHRKTISERLVLMSDTHGKHAKSCCHEETVSFTQETLPEQTRRRRGFECLFPRGYLSTSYFRLPVITISLFTRAITMNTAIAAVQTHNPWMCKLP